MTHLFPDGPSAVDDVQHEVVDPAVGGDHAAGARAEQVAADRADPAAGLGDDQRAGRHVPGLDLRFPVAVEPAGPDVAHVERRGTEPPDRPRALDELPEQADQLFRITLNTVMEAG